MHQKGFKFLIIIVTACFLYSCGSSKKQYTKHRPVSTKKTHKIKKDSRKPSTVSVKVSSSAAKAIKTARSYTGVKYKYGGTTRSGIDCSGLMCNSYKSAGLILPRSSSAQSTIGKRVYVGELLPGDLIFFATGSNKSKITHVGLITEVRSKTDVRFIHASSSKGVREDNVHDPYWRPKYVKAVRP